MLVYEQRQDIISKREKRSAITPTYGFFTSRQVGVNTSK